MESGKKDEKLQNFSIKDEIENVRVSWVSVTGSLHSCAVCMKITIV